MTDRPTFKPGDLVERTGESAMEVVQFAKYVVRKSHYGGRFISLVGHAHQYRASGFRIVEGNADG